MSNGEDLTYENEMNKVKASLSDVEDAKKEADKLMINKVTEYENKISSLKNLEEIHRKNNGDLRIHIHKLEKEIVELKRDNQLLSDDQATLTNRLRDAGL
jgi:GTP1/Obg family GTP-binding protein